MYEPPQQPLHKTGSLMKRLKLARDKKLPTPTADPTQPIRFGTTPKEDKMIQALRILGAGQQFPNAPQQPQPMQGTPDVES